MPYHLSRYTPRLLLLLLLQHGECQDREPLVPEADHALAFGRFLDFWGLDASLDPQYKTSGEETKLDAMEARVTPLPDHDIETTELTGEW